MRLYRCEGESSTQFVKRKAYFARLMQSRFDYSAKCLNAFLNNDKIQPIDKALLKDIKNFWRSYLGNHINLIDFRWYDVFNTIEDDKDLVKYYMPAEFYYPFIDEYYSNPQHSTPCDDKNLYDLYFSGVKMPTTLFRKVGPFYLSDKYEALSADDVLGILRNRKEVIIKLTRFSCGGQGVTFLKTDQPDDVLLAKLSSIPGSFICQDLVKQHPEINKLNDTSLNTLRMQTLVRDNTVKILSSLIRVGQKGSRTDNLTGGGMSCGINPDGSLKNRVFDQDLKKYDLSPQGYRFTDIKIPNYEKCTEIVLKMALRLADISRLISWDVAINYDGEPLLIEANLTFGSLDLPQFSNGPIFGKNPEPIIEEVVNNCYTLRKLLRL